MHSTTNSKSLLYCWYGNRARVDYFSLVASPFLLWNTHLKRLTHGVEVIVVLVYQNVMVKLLMKEGDEYMCSTSIG